VKLANSGATEPQNNSGILVNCRNFFIMSACVPIVDISGWDINNPCKGDINLAIERSWDLAFSTFGCVVLVGHGIPESEFDDINAEMLSFFHLDEKLKMKYNHGKYGHPLGGYTAPGNETVALSTSGVPNKSARDAPKFDPVENFAFTSDPKSFLSPQGLTCPLKKVSEYFHTMETLLDRIHSVSSAALGIKDVHFFRRFYDAGGSSDKNGNTLRLAHYPPVNKYSSGSKASEGTL
jgi:isopenicillin N synthase-like dioxygenase